MHARSIGIENPRDFDVQPVLPVVVVEKSVSAQRLPSS